MRENQTRDRGKSVPLNMRVAEHRRDLIDAAVEIVGGDRTRFVLEAACRRAEEVLMEQRLFLLGDEAFDRFMQALEDNPRLRRNAPNALPVTILGRMGVAREAAGQGLATDLLQDALARFYAKYAGFRPCPDLSPKTMTLPLR